MKGISNQSQKTTSSEVWIAPVWQQCQSNFFGTYFKTMLFQGQKCYFVVISALSCLSWHSCHHQLAPWAFRCRWLPLQQGVSYQPLSSHTSVLNRRTNTPHPPPPPKKTKNWRTTNKNSIYIRRSWILQTTSSESTFPKSILLKAFSSLGKQYRYSEPPCHVPKRCYIYRSVPT